MITKKKYMPHAEMQTNVEQKAKHQMESKPKLNVWDIKYQQLVALEYYLLLCIVWLAVICIISGFYTYCLFWSISLTTDTVRQILEHCLAVLLDLGVFPGDSPGFSWAGGPERVRLIE